MTHNSHILIATDFSPAAPQFLQDLIPVLQRINATVSVGYVITSSFKLWMQSGSIELEAQQRLDHWLSILREKGITTHTAAVRVGNPAEELAALARQLNVGSILVGESQHRWLIGSTADAIIRAAPCSVWIQASRSTAFQHIICACDTSEVSAQALHYAHHLAEQMQARLEVVHCIEAPEANTLGMSAEQVQNLYAQFKASCRQDFENFVAKANLPDSAVSKSLEQVILWGKPSHTVLNYVADSGCDVLVLGATGKSKLQMLTVGSTTRNILRDVPCSVIVVR